MSEGSGAGTQPGSCGPQEGIPGASLDSSGSGRGPGFFMSSRPVARRRKRSLFCLDAAGTLSMSEHMAKRLDIAQLRHVGKNIRILTTDEQ
eukprot:scaffold6323_cov121-Isochrysis_galbana.AAC.6